MKFYYIIIILYLIQLNFIKSINSEKSNDKDTIDDEDDDMEFVKDDTNNDRGIMNVKVFKDKLKKVLMKRKIRRSQKISKTLLREIFDDLYKKELDIDVPLENEGEEGSKGFYEDIYDRVTKGIDPDQEIEASDIKKWISPKRISEAASEIIEYMASPSYYDDL